MMMSPDLPADPDQRYLRAGAAGAPDVPKSRAQLNNHTPVLPSDETLHTPVNRVRVLIDVPNEHHSKVVLRECDHQRVTKAISLGEVHARVQAVQDHLNGLGVYKPVYTIMDKGAGRRSTETVGGTRCWTCCRGRRRRGDVVMIFGT